MGWICVWDPHYSCCVSMQTGVNTLRPRQNRRHFTNDTFKRIFLNENVRISIKISLKFVPKGPINNNPALVQIMAWRRSGDKPLSEPMMVNLLTHLCVTRPQWVNNSDGGPIYIQDTYMVITVSAHALADNNAMSSADTMKTTTLHLFMCDFSLNRASLRYQCRFT